MKKIIFMSFVAAAALATFSCKCKSSSCSDKAACTITTSQLTGKWNVTNLMGEAVNTENPVTMEFAAENKLHAQLGCNIFNSTYTFDEKESTIKFAENGQRTMMMCPDMQTEDKMMQAIQQVAKVKKEDANIVLQNANGDALITLSK